MTELTKKFFIETYGCQMNKYDSEIIASILQKEGYQRAHNLGDATIILVNTCSVREHAESRVLGHLNALKSYKSRNQGIVIGVLGCMAQRLGNRITAEKPFVDFILGPDSYRRLPRILEDMTISKHSRNVGGPESEGIETYDDIYPCRQQTVRAWLAIMRGCNNFCSYCVVPYVRGRERSRPARNIIDEVHKLVDEGFHEVTLLGQNVNSYWDNGTDFADLISRVGEVKGLKRVRFATSHPKDLSEKLMYVISESQTICKHVHLPVQSGSDKILKLMNRRYTREDYLRLVEKLRKVIKDVALTTDIIVGFPGETEADFEDTLDLVKTVGFDNAYTFKYSAREGTKAYELKEYLSEEEKIARLVRLNQVQKAITRQRNKSLIGETVEVLVEGRSKKSQEQLMGRTDTNKIVVFSGNHIPPGTMVRLKVVNAEGVTLFGEIL